MDTGKRKIEITKLNKGVIIDSKGKLKRRETR
jgi:hypothetical protein